MCECGHEQDFHVSRRTVCWGCRCKVYTPDAVTLGAVAFKAVPIPNANLLTISRMVEHGMGCKAGTEWEATEDEGTIAFFHGNACGYYARFEEGRHLDGFLENMISLLKLSEG